MPIEDYCAKCGEKLKHDLKPQELAEHKVFKCGELSYIERAHRDCAVKCTDDFYSWKYTKLEGCCDGCGRSGLNEVDEVFCIHCKGHVFEK